MSINDRILILINLLEEGNQRAFARNVGLPVSTLSGVIGARRSDPSYSILKKIINAYPLINLNWLIQGVGKPLTGQTKKSFSEKEKPDLTKENTEISERVSLMIQKLSVSPNSFATNLGYERSQTIYDIINAKSAPSYDFFRRFMLSEYSEMISIDWLLTGRGKMIIEEGDFNVGER